MENYEFIKKMLETHCVSKEVDGDYTKYLIGVENKYKNVGTEENPYYKVYQSNEVYIYLNELDMLFYEETEGFRDYSFDKMLERIDIIIMKHKPIEELDKDLAKAIAKIEMKSKQSRGLPPKSFCYGTMMHFGLGGRVPSITVKYDVQGDSEEYYISPKGVQIVYTLSTLKKYVSKSH